MGAASACAQSWTARWIWAQSGQANQWVAFRKTVTLARTPSSAPTRIAADTKYWLYVNGTLVVFEGGLKGGPTPDAIYYDEIDLAPYLQAGRNTIALLVWTLGKDGYSHHARSANAGGLLFQSDVAEGPAIASDDSWRATVHPGYQQETSGRQPNFRLPESNVYFDARAGAPLEGWTAADFNDSSWPPAADRGSAGASPWGALLPRPIPLFRFTDVLPYTSVSTSRSGSTTIAVGHLPSNLQITPYLKVDAPPGATIAIQTDRYMDGGDANVRATYVTRGGVQTFESPGWMSGTAVQYQIPAGVQIHVLGYRESGFATDLAGSFSSSDAFLDRLWQKAARTVYVSMRDSYMDCPTRERAQWWADEVNEIRAGAYVFDTAAYRLGGKGVRELVAWRRPTEELYSPVPTGVWQAEMPQQMLASIWGAWRYYMLSGDSAWVPGAYRAFADYLDRWSLGPDGLVVHRAGDWDWQDAGDAIDGPLLENAWYAMAAHAVAEMARIVGNTADEARWRSRESTVFAGFDAFWDASRQVYRSRHYHGDADDRGNALAVVAGLVPALRYPAVTRALRDHANASPYLEFYVLEALYQMGAPDVAVARMHSRYAAEVDGNEAGPTLWESWDGRGTRNHGWNSGPLHALSAYAAGVRPLDAGFTRVEIQPQPGALANVKASVPTARGTIGVDVTSKLSGTNTSVTLSVDVPNGVSAHVAVPWGSLLSGRIVANGTEVDIDGVLEAMPSGLTAARDDGQSVWFDVAPGRWVFERTGVMAPPPPPPPFGPAPKSVRPPSVLGTHNGQPSR
ncbi:MAG TPA: alpha-L-rhamnosidase C-terminal domain-containing protein [Gemmatimonadaceae bacterium]|nr:alpha-L-rhamnosidase C-terminal domain-containing protein [Gemmatimonadaceae bacterium]